MAKNVAEAIEQEAKGLYDKLASNNDLGNVVMAFIARIVILCKEKGTPIQGVECGAVTETNDEFRFGVAFNHLALSAPSLWQPQDDLYRYALSRSAGLAKALTCNHKILKTFKNLVEAIDRYCKRKRILFEDFKLKKSFIHPKTNVFVLRAGVPEFNDRFH